MAALKAYLRILLPLLVAASCSGGQSSGADATVRDEAGSVARTAAAALSLSPGEELLLEEAVCGLFCSLETQPGTTEDDSERSVRASEAYKAFQQKIRASFPADRSAEILAWYYNYSNTNSIQ